ncbi:hypothetical protein FUA26_07020 [Seonamhaeicola algicola]|uniref:DUF5362 domain-containing protein n=1 Tax=Seonamhaeicola algicola TaxID=1719036 RepID=A0A5C7AW55_9FLAO|nr:DUF5362 family protein [Seonamhaeicola algicola]TXE11809.1 hypothetical protein FUA26_07020 [Seonamhaeicola algicola]
MKETSAFESFELGINSEIKDYLTETVKWSSFLAILGFVGVGLMIFAGIIMGITGAASSGLASAYGAGYASGIALFYIILAAVYFFPVMYLFRFSKSMKSALKQENNNDFAKAFSSLKSHYKFLGIFSIVLISLYILVIIGAVIGASLF